MARRPRPLVSILTAGAAIAVAAAGLQPGASAQGQNATPPAKPDKVVIILVDALSREIVDRYDMDNVQALMAEGVDTPRGYLGHTGSVTVVTHNVITSGLLPKHMGWTNEGYRDVEDILPDGKEGNAGEDLYITSNWGSAEMFAVQEHYGYPKLDDYLNDTGKVFTISPKGYAAYGFGGAGSDSIITFGSVTCPDGSRWRGPVGISVPSYITGTCGSRYYVERSKIYDTGKLPASLYPALDDRYVVGDEPGHQGGDIWATDAALDVMDHEDWSGLFVSLPGVDKAAHMWGGVNDPGPMGPDGDPMTHMEFAAATADAQVSRIVDALEESGELDNTLVVLTADHGSVAGEHFHGLSDPALDYGFFNWYFGDVENDPANYNKPQPALQPLVDTGNLGLSYSDSSINVWLKDQSPEKVAEAAEIMAGMPDVTAVWRRDGEHFTRVSPIRWDLMHSGGERAWFARKAQELVDTQAADYGPDLVATLPDHTTYSVAGDHGGIQRASQQIPIVFAGAGLSSRDLQAEVRSVDIMPTILAAMGIVATHPMDGIAYPLPTKAPRP
jgi:hypothetical protein